MVLGFQCDSLYQLEKYNAFYDLSNDLKSIKGVEQTVSLLQSHNMKKNEATKSFDFEQVSNGRLKTQQQAYAERGA